MRSSDWVSDVCSSDLGGNLPSSFSIVLSSALVCSTSPPVSVSGTVYKRGLFPGTASRHGQSDKPAQLTPFVTTRRSRNINLVPIDYGFRPLLHRKSVVTGKSVSVRVDRGGRRII